MSGRKVALWISEKTEKHLKSGEIHTIIVHGYEEDYEYKLVRKGKWEDDELQTERE